MPTGIERAAQSWLWGYTGGLIVLSGFIIVVYIGLQRRLVGIDVGEKAFPSSEV
jgi:hypothetical protein